MTPEQTEKPTIAERLRVVEADAAAFFHDCTALQKRLAEAEKVLRLNLRTSRTPHRDRTRKR